MLFLVNVNSMSSWRIKNRAPEIRDEWSRWNVFYGLARQKSFRNLSNCYTLWLHLNLMKTNKTKKLLTLLHCPLNKCSWDSNNTNYSCAKNSEIVSGNRPHVWYTCIRFCSNKQNDSLPRSHFFDVTQCSVLGKCCMTFKNQLQGRLTKWVISYDFGTRQKFTWLWHETETSSFIPWKWGKFGDRKMAPQFLRPYNKIWVPNQTLFRTVDWDKADNDTISTKHNQAKATSSVSLSHSSLPC